MRCLRGSVWGSKRDGLYRDRVSLSGSARWWRGDRARLRGVKFSFACQKRTRKAPAISTRWIHEKGAARPFQTPKELSKHKNASRFAKRIFCTSPVYGSADGVTLQQDFTFCKGVKSAAKQQMGETRKKCNSDDRRLRRIQGGAVGAAVSRTRVPLKARSGRWVSQPVLAKRLAFLGVDFLFGIVKGEQPLTRCGESGVQR